MYTQSFSNQSENAMITSKFDKTKVLEYQYFVDYLPGQ